MPRRARVRVRPLTQAMAPNGAPGDSVSGQRKRKAEQPWPCSRAMSFFFAMGFRPAVAAGPVPDSDQISWERAR